MKLTVLILEIIGILALSLVSVCAITALLCFAFGVPYTFPKALVIWLVWFVMNIARSKANEHNA